MLLQVKASPYCVRLIDAWIQFGYIYIQTEICKRGRYDKLNTLYFDLDSTISLATYLEEHCSETPVTEDQIWRILADISQVFLIEKEPILNFPIHLKRVYIIFIKKASFI
jgi:hypothetical protein